MKKILFFFAVSFFICSTGIYAQSDSSKATAKIYVIRATGHQGGGINLRVLVNDSLYCKIRNNRYSIIEVKPGIDTFYITNWGTPKANSKLGLELQIEPGKTYYLRMAVKERYFEVLYYFEEITKNSAEPLLAKYKQDTNCDK